MYVYMYVYKYTHTHTHTHTHAHAHTHTHTWVNEDYWEKITASASYRAVKFILRDGERER
jgi:hypothetical protein